MFEQELYQMTAGVWFGEKDVSYADQEGLGHFHAGFNKLDSETALNVVRLYDKAMINKHYATKRNRLRAQRNAIVTAFGQDMVELVGIARSSG